MTEADLPPPTFSFLVTQLATQALLQLGDAPSPVTGKRERSLPRAQFTIGLLEILADRTQGNLEPEEERLLLETLTRLKQRLR